MAANPSYLQALNAPSTAGRLPSFLDPDEPATVSVPVPHDFVPTSAADLAVCLSDPMWRICSGVLYKIMVKGDDNDDSDDALVVPFKPNRAQRRLLKKMHSRNIILKARQLGFTTLICIFFLDCALFRNKRMLLGFRPANGQQVLARVRVSLYEGRGDFQLVVEHLELGKSR